MHPECTLRAPQVHPDAPYVHPECTQAVAEAGGGPGGRWPPLKYFELHFLLSEVESKSARIGDG